MNSKLCLIDGNSIFYRAFFAIKASLTTSSGQPTNAVFGFIKMLNRIVDEIQPQYMAVCFDVGKKTHRSDKFAEYKAKRPPMPDDLLSQVPLIKEVVRAYNFSVCEAAGFEADDVIATLAVKMRSGVDKVVIISSDKDMLQLVGKNIEVYNPYKDDGIVFTPEVVKEKFGVEPHRILDLIALMGDASDNIPGAKGIGEKTALELLNSFKDVPVLLKNISQIKRESVRKIVENSIDSIELSRDLARLKDDVELNVNLEDLKVKDANQDKLWEIFTRLEFKGMLRTLNQDRMSSQPRDLVEVEREELNDTKMFFEKIKKTGVFAFFINEENSSVSSVSVNLAFDEEKVYETQDKALLIKLFSQKEYIAVGHGIKKSKHFLQRCGIEVKTKFFDTMLAAHLVESSNSSVELESLLWDHLSLAGVNRLDFIAKESHFLLKLYQVLQKKLEDKGLSNLFEGVETPLLNVLFDMEFTGVALDIDFLKQLSIDADVRLKKLVKSIHDIAGCSFNINSPKQLSEILFQKLAMPVVKKTKTGMSTDEEVLTKLSKKYELPKILLEYRQLSKLKNTYIDALPQLVSEGTNKIHTTFNQAGTETGRLSSSSPNLQNIPIKTEAGRNIRRAFIPSKGFDFILSADYSQIELRILAHLSKDETLLNAFKKDLDIHRYTASLILGVDEKDVTDEMRDNAKRVNFGIIYGMSSYGLAKDLGIDAIQAQNFIEEYFLRYPRVKDFLDGEIKFVKENGFVSTILGRRRYIPEISNPNAGIRQFAERQAINAPVQGSAADLIKKAMVDVSLRLKKEDLKSRLILQVHDELVFEVINKEKDALIELVRTCMEGALKLSVPLKTTISIGKNWLETGEVS